MESEKNSRAIFAPDTNFFIQCKDPQDIDWSLVSDAEVILLVVLNEVHRELDRLKSGGNARRARRAKLISSQLRQLIVENNDQVQLSARSPRVFLALSPRLDPKRVRPEDFDQNSADERIAEEAKTCSESFYEGRLTLLSHDGMPLRAGKLMGVNVCAISDDWLLTAEPSDQDRELKKLSERLLALEKQAPKIALSFEGGSKRIEGEIDLFLPLSDHFVKDTMEAIRAKFPMQLPTRGRASSAMENLIRGFDPEPTDEAMREYEEKHQEWLDKLEQTLKLLPLAHQDSVDGISVIFELSNKGSVPAERLVVDISATGAIKLQERVDEGDAVDGVPKLPHPPKPKSNAMLDALYGFNDRTRFQDSIANIRFETPRVARDRHAFYWEYDEPEDRSSHCRGECEDFRHGFKAERIELLLTWSEPAIDSVAGAIKIAVSARNTPIPVEQTFPVRLSPKIRDSEDLVRSAVLEELGVRI